jgi:hypothetical protein
MQFGQLKRREFVTLLSGVAALSTRFKAHGRGAWPNPAVQQSYAVLEWNVSGITDTVVTVDGKQIGLWHELG